MPAFGPISRGDLIRFLRELDFHGPYTRGRHQYMVKEQLKLTIPNPRQGDISRDLVARILRQAGINRDDWERL